MAKSKPHKNRYLGARVDEQLEKEVDAYVEAADMVMGDLLRKAVREYMLNHPVKVADEPLPTLTKPGE